MVASKTSIVLAAIALNAASSYAAPTHYSSDLAARGLGDEDLQLVARFFDDEELEARDYEDEFEARDYEDEFEARDVEDEFEARDFDEEEDLFARDFDDDEYLFARDAAQPSTVPANSTSSTQGSPPAKLVDTTKPQNSTLDAVKAANGTQLNSSPSGNSTKPASAKPKQNNKKKTAPRPHRPHRHHAHHNGTHHGHHNGTHHGHHNGTHHGHHNGTHHARPHNNKSKPKQQNANNATLTPSTKNSTAVTDTKSKIQKEPDFGSGPSTNGTSSLTVQPNQKAKRSFADFMENLVARNRHHRNHNNNNKPKEQGEKKPKEQGEKKKYKEQGEKKYKEKSKDNSASSTNSTTPSDVTTSTTTDTSTPVTARDMVILARSLGLDDDYFLEERSFEDDLYEY